MKFIFRQTVDAHRDVVFAFFRNPRCLPLLHIAEKHICVLRHGSDVRIGSETWAEVTLFGLLPVVLGFRHDIFEPPARFGESLIHGPFKIFTHIHEFNAHDARTEIIDHLDVQLPWYYGGELGVKLLVWPGMKRSFDTRHRELETLVESGDLHRHAGQNLTLLEAL
jgi:ligand-binding SRPBCC domain-containing protein